MTQIKNLLLVDDDEIFVYIILQIIEETGFAGEIKVCNNGKDAIEYLDHLSGNIDSLPEVIFLDLSMPVLDGWGFIEEYLLLKPRIGKNIIIYIVSSSVSPHDLQRAKNISIVTDFIIKPVSKEKFIEIIKKMEIPL